MTLALVFRKRHDGHGPASVPGRLALGSAVSEHRFRAFGQSRSGLYGTAFAVILAANAAV